MNPYFEQPGLWRDFHAEFLTRLRRQLVPQLGPGFFVQIEEHIDIHDVPIEGCRFVGRADLSVSSADDARSRPSGLGILEAPATLQLPAQDVERVPFLEVRDRQSRELLTVIELLSPSNKKGGEDREQHLAKRRERLRSPANLVEIDLLRGGRPMPPHPRPDCDYSVLVSRPALRPDVGFWPIGLRDRLPVIPIPLREGVDDARIDLQETLHRAYDGPGYENFIYASEPQPALAAADAEWARGFLPSRA
jgi:hypothetical protein